MSQLTFDTLEFADTLRKAGVPPEQAEAFSRASQKAFGQMLELKDVATKKDILELRAEMADMRTDLIKWMVGCNIALAAVLISVMAWLK